MLRDLGGWHLLIILGIVVLLFGSTKLPALTRGVAQSMRIFKSEMKEPKEPATATSTAAPTAPAAGTTAPTVAEPVTTPNVPPTQ
ncbi:twin-arginine translocase TatA/TatE family subunit [Frondihabitans australicus]|uniref:Sec-independent protein translocase protein TatA n=1 Tax=Frondihabitans australicus TaxID=386892 RepID=A0A495IMG1_9MICO|nr:twin-arginine translocase TatA/TatE family subunit [Frondihabitans australicus]RKR76618.1 sec-independent protein translocase protein TatA [Frondihabitans australicus]